MRATRLMATGLALVLTLGLATLDLATLGSVGPASAEPPPVLNLPREIARRIAGCWHPPSEGDEITLRLSFRRDGSLFGKPRITYVKAVGGADGEAALANSIFAAIQACGPLRFTPALGGAIAGRTFLIRFVAPRKTLRAAL